MTLLKAIAAVLRVCFGLGECTHAHVAVNQGPSFCPDCGYRIKVEWLFVQCRGCNAKRLPQNTVLGGIQPLHPYCRHCGHEGFKLVKKQRIEVYELMYALSIKSVLYEELPDTPAAAEGIRSNPFQTQAFMEPGKVYEAEVVQKTEIRGTKSAFQSNPFSWQQSATPPQNRRHPEHKAPVLQLRRIS